jgi:hypothetical protein
MSGVRENFKRSSRFGLAGVFVVAALTAAIALVFGQGSANPTAALAVILAIVFIFVFVLLRLQRADLDSAEARSKLEAAAPTDAFTDPTTVELPSLLAALAIKPIDHDAINRASSNTWGIARGSINSAGVLMVLIFFAVVPWQLFQFKWSLIVVVPIIVLYASYLAARAIGSGGTLDQAYEDSAATTEPLGLELVERPEVVVRRRIGGSGAQADVVGAVAYSGRRHGRAVSIRIEGGATTTLSGAVKPFEVKVKGERLRASASSPGPVAAVIDPLRPSSYWKGVTITGSAGGVTVERKKAGGEHWMRDLWLAERLADAARG